MKNTVKNGNIFEICCAESERGSKKYQNLARCCKAEDGLPDRCPPAFILCGTEGRYECSRRSWAGAGGFCGAELGEPGRAGNRLSAQRERRRETALDGTQSARSRRRSADGENPRVDCRRPSLRGHEKGQPEGCPFTGSYGGGPYSRPRLERQTRCASEQSCIP